MYFKSVLWIADNARISRNGGQHDKDGTYLVTASGNGGGSSRITQLHQHPGVGIDTAVGAA